MKNTMTFDEHLDKRYGEIGSEKRTEFEIKAKAFAIAANMKINLVLTIIIEKLCAKELVIIC